MYVPPGFGTVAPYLFVDGAADYIEFLLRAFDCEEVGRTEHGEIIMNCQVRFGTATIMLGDVGGRFEPSRSALYLYVEDADVAMQRALDAGATKVMDVDDMPYGDRQGGVVDPAGNTWWISQRLVEKPYH